eukprot:TRINITY_DN10954_c0_g1_i3.p1 TRINITY_DN10954_c0_g1~~TRINITY_DN10954_c0_g1_i3.p1  ORF type:complete len:356 (-),score=73.39 TRINITY_DN10954_c0_g1_i3:362-1351(-)
MSDTKPQLEMTVASLSPWLGEIVEEITPNDRGLGSSSGLVRLQSGRTLFVKIGVALPEPLLSQFNLGLRESTCLVGEGVVPEDLKPNVVQWSYDEESQVFAVAMETLEGFGDHLIDTTRDQTKALIHALTRLHACTRGKDDHLRSRLPELTSLPNFSLDTDWPALVTLIRDMNVVIPPDFRGDDLSCAFPLIKTSLSKTPSVLLHCDAHQENVAWTMANVRLCDWQLAAIGAGAYDIAYVASNISSAEDRRYVHEELLKEYAESMGRNIVDVEKEYAFACVWGLAWMAGMAKAGAGAKFEPESRNYAIFKKVLEGWLWLVHETDPLKYI